MDKLKHYIRNHKEIPKVHSSFNVNFIKIYQKLLKSVTDPDKSEIGFLQKQINTSGNFSKREWVLGKINELNN
ncbi:MAG: hypothetical protein M3R36_14010 [Bacteroidota bacterium]|nr:hypothetical protein [Bacteroidota bacterium]